MSMLTNINDDNLLTTGRLYGLYLLEFMLNNRIFNFAQLNLYYLGIDQQAIEIGLEYLTVTNYLTREKPDAKFIN